jgi:hypothetical protein
LEIPLNSQLPTRPSGISLREPHVRARRRRRSGAQPVNGFIGEAVTRVSINNPRPVISGSSSLLDRILFAFAASYHNIAAGARQQTKKRTRFAAGAFCENRAYNKLASMSVIMLHMNTVAMILCTRLNRAITS